jgi:hypothetical protein
MLDRLCVYPIVASVHVGTGLSVFVSIPIALRTNPVNFGHVQLDETVELVQKELPFIQVHCTSFYTVPRGIRNSEAIPVCVLS